MGLKTAPQHENYIELIWMLAKTDFKLRYHGSVLGYLWAILSPLLMFAVLYFVFTSILNFRDTGTEYYALELLIALMMFGFFSEGTSAGMNALLGKAQLVNKIYVPRWILIIAATINALMIYVANIVVVILFFFLFSYVPSLQTIFLFIVFSLSLYIFIVGFSLAAAPLYARFRDLILIWEVITRVLFFATPIMYSLLMLPAQFHRLVLVNPIAFVIHFTKESISSNRTPDGIQIALFIAVVSLSLAIGIWIYRKTIPSIAEKI